MDNRTWVEINKKAILNNLKGYLSAMPDNAEVMPVIKANAYGHGQEIVMDIIAPFVNNVAVFTMEDALSIRAKYKDVNILVLNQVYLNELDLAIKNNIDITVANINTLKKIVVHSKVSDILINLKIDTGLSRQGLQIDHIPDVLKILKQNPKANIVSIYTHLIGAENKEFDKYTEKQYHEINIWQDKLNKNGYYPLVHTSATSGYLMQDRMAFDIVRLGIGLYGLWPSNEVEESSSNMVKLTPVLSWKASITQVKNIKKGDTVAYDATFTATKDMKIGIVSVGYWDGIPRSLSNNGYMLVKGVKCKILGRVMMNMCVIDLSSVKSVKSGDTAAIIGQSQGLSISTEEFASLAGTINYEVITRINPSIKRIAK